VNDVLAQITLDPKPGKAADLSIVQKSFRFKCTRCAALCCKLGGPALTKKDVDRIKDAGYRVKDFLEPTNGKRSSVLLSGDMKSREDGSCVFLEFDAELNCYKCGIYDIRPLLCRFYPFSLEIDDSNCIALKFIPCCKGLNNPEGEPLDEKFVSNNLLELLPEAVELYQKRVAGLA
jgi:Fe-S-cluster containining protein